MLQTVCQPTQLARDRANEDRKVSLPYYEVMAQAQRLTQTRRACSSRQIVTQVMTRTSVT